MDFITAAQRTEIENLTFFKPFCKIRCFICTSILLVNFNFVSYMQIYLFDTTFNEVNIVYSNMGSILSYI